jgi:hypothetical protein
MDEKRLDALFNGLTAVHTTTENKLPVHQSERKKAKGNTSRSKQKKHEQENGEERFCTIVSAEAVKKLRIIATREGLQIKDVVDAAFTKAIASYERKHGKIEDKPKKNTADLF